VGILEDHIIGSHFFDQVRSMAKYRKFLQILSTYWKKYHWNHILMCGSSRTAILYTVKATGMLLNRKFVDYQIGLGTFAILTNGHRNPHEWSPNLTPLDFFLW